MSDEGRGTKDEIRRLVAKIIKLPEEKVSYEANLFTELNVDSLLGVEIFAALDKKYGVNISEDQLRRITTLNDLIDLVVGQLAKK
ncbi:MAG: acyl carrier protein [Candidatus Margulisbacteria bacterium]|jgi:acyl carrier protein|nr:acyl carrier protein [Candidatus Margulisiibacteriota bacterium]